MESKLKRVVVGMFDTAADATRAVRELRDARFSDKHIGILTRDEHGAPDVKTFKELEGNEAPTGAAIGAAAGAGSAALWALGVAAGFLPAIGPVIAGGLLAAVAASAAAGAGAGTIVGTLVGLGVSDEDAAYYDDEFRRGRTIVIVKSDDRLDLASTILRAHDAVIRELTTPTTLGQQIAADFGAHR